MCHHCRERSGLQGHEGHRICCFCKMDLDPVQEAPYRKSPLQRIHELERELREKKLEVDAMRDVVEAAVVLSTESMKEGPGIEGAMVVLLNKVKVYSERQQTEKRNCQIPVDDGPCGMLLPCVRHK